ncbi:MAG: response regulator [Verrucomicrobiota bacterium]|jgi:CheY-like chemotaxis protein
MNNPPNKIPVLIVDDDESIPRTVSKILKGAGYPVSTAADGEQGLQLLLDGFQGLVLMDVMMPGMDGWKTIRKIKDLNLLDGNLICMMTALTEPTPGNEDLSEIVFDYLAKPFDGPQLLDIVHLANGQLVA